MEKKKSPNQILKECRQEIVKNIERWKFINDNGCNDPFWADGCNMNLVRNHIIYYKQNILQLCEENGFSLPEEYFLSLPPEVYANYMANLKQEERVKRIQCNWTVLNTRKPRYNEEQLSLF